MYRSSPLVPLDSCLTAAACLSSAYSFAVSQVSDLAVLVGYEAWEDLNFLSKPTVAYSVELFFHELLELGSGQSLVPDQILAS